MGFRMLSAILFGRRQQSVHSLQREPRVAVQLPGHPSETLRGAAHPHGHGKSLLYCTLHIVVSVIVLSEDLNYVYTLILSGDKRYGTAF